MQLRVTNRAAIAPFAIATPGPVVRSVRPGPKRSKVRNIRDALPRAVLSFAGTSRCRKARDFGPATFDRCRA